MFENIYASTSHLLAEAEIEKIHEMSLKILAEIGVKIEDEAVRAEFKAEGCQVSGDRVKFPPAFIEEVLAEKDELYEQNDYLNLKIKNPYSGTAVRFKQGQVFSQPFGTVAKTLDLDKEEPRPVDTQDLIDFIQLQNRLKNIDFTGPSVIPGEFPAKIRELKMSEISLRYSQKPFGGIGASRSEEVDYIIELMQIVRDSQADPIGGLGVSPESPLSYPKQITDIIRKVARTDIPLKILAAPIAGLTSPITVAGSLAQMNASMLAFTAIVHLVNPAAFLFFCARLSFPNMKKGYSIWGLPEIGLGSAAAVQLARYYGFYSTVYGVSTTSCNIDVQAGYEKAFNSLLPALAGANILSGAGSLASNTLASKGQLVVDNEVITIVKRIISGYRIDADTLAFELIQEAAEDGDYIAQKHTVEHLRSGEVYHSDFGFDSFWYEWEEAGYPQLANKAEEKARAILKETSEQVLTSEQDRAFTKVLAKAEERLL